MNKEEFKNHVIKEAQKYLFSTENDIPADTLKLIKESVKVTAAQESAISPSEIKKLAEEIKKINKTIDLRNPLISESNESLVENIMKENSHVLRERQLDVDDINKSKHTAFKNEGEKDKWNRMLNYNVPFDEERL